MQVQQEMATMQSIKQKMTGDDSPLKIWDRDLCVRAYKVRLLELLLGRSSLLFIAKCIDELALQCNWR